MRGEEPVTQFGRMCAKLGITLIAANSPQAKGRVERQHGTHQDRLVKKLRRRGIYSYEGSNVFLEREHLPEHNQRFGRCAARPENYHRKAPCAAELDRIFRLESERTVSDDWVVRYDNHFFQLEPQSVRSRSVSGRRRPAIRGMNRPARRCRSEPRGWPPPRRARRWPGPALRPKRFALRATQGYAPGQANRAEKQGSRRSTEKRIVVPRAC